MPTTTLSLPLVTENNTADLAGVVYTRPWVTNLMLDLAGYQVDINLVDKRAVEPSCGQGAFLVPMVRRLLASCRRQQRTWLDCLPSLRAYEIDASAALVARQRVISVCLACGVPEEEAATLGEAWVVTADYLMTVGEQFGGMGSGAPGLFDTATTPELVDFVVGNPPYVRLESIPAKLNERYRRYFPTMTARADLYVGFFEAALRQLRPGGVCAFICADRWMVNQYGETLRSFITRGYAVEAVVEMHRADAFEEEVDAYPAITVIRRAPQNTVVVASAEAGVENAPVEKLLAALRDHHHTTTVPGLAVHHRPGWFQGGDPWPRVSPGRLALLQDLEGRFPVLEDSGRGTRVKLGIATGADAVFITLQTDAVEPEQQLRLARPEDIRTGTLRWSGSWLISPWVNGQLTDLTHRPRLGTYLRQHRATLEKRYVAQKNPQGWYRTIDKVEAALYHRPKLYIPDIKNTVFPVLDRGETYPDHNLYCIVSDEWDLEVLGGLLLSTFGTFFVECYGVRMRGGYLRMQAQYLRRVRVPHPSAITPELAVALRCAFRERDVQRATAAALLAYGIDHLPT